MEADDCYPVEVSQKTQKIGKVLILSFENFEDSSEDRNGGQFDRIGLTFMLENIGFDVQVEVNLTGWEVRRIVELTAENTELSNVFICIVLSHGAESTHFFCTDGEKLCLVTDIISPLQQSKNMKNLVKIYMANFCRENTQASDTPTTVPATQSQLSTLSPTLQDLPLETVLVVTNDDSLSSGGVNNSEKLEEKEEIEEIYLENQINTDNDHMSLVHNDNDCDSDDEHYLNELNFDAGSSDRTTTSAFPSAAFDNLKVNLTNTVVVFSTLPNTVSWRNAKRGSVFIEQFIRVMHEKHHIWDFLRIINHTNKLINHKQNVHCQLFGISQPIVLRPTVSIIMLNL